MPKLPASLREITRENVPLSTLTTWKIGGPAKWVIEPSREHLPALARWITDEGVPFFLLGRGSNTLAMDEGFDGAIILSRDSLTALEVEGDRLMAEAGVSLPRLSKAAAKQGAGGYEFLIGIPGTVGGALAMNAGLTVYRPREIREIVEDVEFVDTHGRCQRVSYEDLHPGYRTSDILSGGIFLSRAWFKVPRSADPDEIHRRTLEHLAERKRKQPLDRPTAGSTFKQPTGGKPAGWYIEQAGLRGLQVGQVRVSPKHANWIENLGGGSAVDVERLIGLIKNTVTEKFAIHLEEEIRYLKSAVRREPALSCKRL